MKPLIRNFLSVIRRFKMAVALNVLGLSVAFAAFMIIMMQLDYDLGFDKFHKDYDKIFRVEKFHQTEASVLFNRPDADIIFESSPHIVESAVISAWEGIAPFFVEKDGERNYYEEISLAVLPSFFDVFTFDFVEGSKKFAPRQVIIPLSLSRKLFGNEPAVGKQIIHDRWGHQTIMAVYRDLPANSIFKNYIYFAMNENENKNNRENNVYNAYIRVDHASNTSQLLDAILLNAKSKGLLNDDYDVEKDKSQHGYRITALPDIHFVTGVALDESPKASKQTLMILLAIGIVIITIASINFTNFSTALAPVRVKNINTRRVLGASLNMTRLSLVSEVVVISLLSYLLSLLLFLLFKTTPLANLVEADLSLSVHPYIVGGTAFVALFVGLLAGLYPAFYMTSFTPALVLNSSFGLSPKGKKLRNTLISIQYIASLALITGATFMYLQNRFMQNFPLGYEKENLITVDIAKIQRSRDAFTNQLKAYSGIEDVTFGNTLLLSRDEYGGVGRSYKGVGISFGVFPVHHTFLKVMGIDITEGRDFRVEDTNTSSAIFVFNEAARKKFDMEIGTSIEKTGEGDAFGGEIIGFISDVNFASLRKSVEPMAFVVLGTVNWGMLSNQAYIKMKAGADKRATMKFIHSSLAEFGPEYTFNVRFFDEVVQKLYEKEITLSLLITLFSVIAIFISIVGVFGLVVFDSESRRKEIGIRKVLGASTIGIIIMFNKAYFKILVICFVMAAPLAWYAVNRWLENFAYKTPMYWWVYLLAFVAVGVITAATVTFQNWRVASDNPLKAIKSE